MLDFNDLPVDTLPLILQQLVRPQHVAAACRVNKTFHSFAAPLLYERISIFAWQKQAKVKVIALLRTLASSPQLARYVRKLELRDFPKVLPIAEREELIDKCVKSLVNCVNLRSCTWTRHGSINNHILESFQHCPILQEIEVNGHHERYYDPRLLIALHGLHKISLIMPTRNVVQLLPTWCQNNRSTLRSLSLICKSSPVVTDKLLMDLSHSLAHLEVLSLAGCSKLTHNGVSALLAQNVSGITDLRLEAVSQAFNTAAFSRQCRQTGVLRRLHTVTLTLPVQGDLSSWLFDLEDLLSDSPLLYFHLYTAGGSTSSGFSAVDRSPESTYLDQSFIDKFCATHGHRLLRFAVLRLSLDIDALDIVCCRCTKLEQLFISLRTEDIPRAGSVINQATNLQSLHISSTFEQSDGKPAFIREELIALLSQCGPSIKQFGIHTRVWQVVRKTVEDPSEADNLATTIELAPYESRDVPDVFLVMRT